jgi:hypothetical protein
MSKRTYVTAIRLEALDKKLSGSDRAVIDDIARLGIMSGAQIRQLHYSDDASARRLCRLHLARLVSERILIRLDRRVGGVRAGSNGFVYGLDVAGRRLVDPHGTRWWPRSTPGEPFVAHGLAVSDLYVQLRDAERTGACSLVRFDAEPACWRRFAGPGGSRAILKPDAHAVLEADEFEDHFFVEIDRATEPTNRIADKAKLYVRYWQSGREQDRAGVFPLVLWVVPHEHRRAQLIETLARLDAEHWHLFAVTTSDSAVDLMTEVPAAQLSEPGR